MCPGKEINSFQQGNEAGNRKVKSEHLLCFSHVTYIFSINFAMTVLSRWLYNTFTFEKNEAQRLFKNSLIGRAKM